MLNTIDVEIVVFIFLIIVSSQIINLNITILVSSLITFKSEKDIIFILNNFNFRALILVI